MIEETNYLTPAQEYMGGTIAKSRRVDVSLRQNIDAQIKAAEEHVETLKATKERLEKSGILDARIDDIQRAMRF